MNNFFTSSYLAPAIDHTLRASILIQAREYVTKTPFSHWAVRGMSGTLFAVDLAYQTQKPVLIVRKNDNSHGNAIESICPTPIQPKFESYAIFDDLIYSGATMNSIIERLRLSNAEIPCVGIYLYNDLGKQRKAYLNIPITHYHAAEN